LGFASDLYAWGGGRVLKLFHASVPTERIDREYRISKAICSAGLPAPAPLERVRVSARSGIVFERVVGVTMYRHVRAKPWLLLKDAKWLAELHAQLHRFVAPLELPNQRERIARGIDAAPVLSDSARREARKRLAQLPDAPSVCHGDFHPENILLTEHGPIVVDCRFMNKSASPPCKADSRVVRK
jgi:Ser/Thr protein kinase RdoA (MazF antagonist)